MKQLIFDILYDKYLTDSPRVTLYTYCTKHVHYDWGDSIYNATDSKELGVSRALFHKYISCVFADLAKVGSTSPLIAEKINANRFLQDDVNLQDCDLLEYLECIKDELAKKKIAVNHAMIDEIKRETEIMSSPVLKKDALKLGVDPDLFVKHIRTFYNKGEQSNTMPKHVWDYFYYNSCPDLITSKQFRRNFKRDSNTSYQRFIDDFNQYDCYVESIIPKAEDTSYDYFRKTMDFYHLEIYKRLDFIYTLAKKADDGCLMDFDKEYSIIKRFHPIVFLPIAKHGEIEYNEKNKYYRPPIFIESVWVEQNLMSENANYDALAMYRYIRAKAYELFKHNFEFQSNDYEAISDYLRSHCSVLSFHESCKEWFYEEHGKIIYRKKRIENVLNINSFLFGKRKWR